MNKELTNIVLPPKNPTHSKGDWRQVADQLCDLPGDYKRLVETYGAGCFDGFIWVFSPFSTNEQLNLLQQARTVNKSYDELLREFGEPKTYPIFPEKEGLLVFGITDNGDYLFWRTIGKPDTWTVIVGAAREPRYESFNCSATQFLEGILSGELKSNIFPIDFPSEVRKLNFHS